MILITDREYAEIVMRLGQLMAANRDNNRLYNHVRLVLSILRKADRNRKKRIGQWKRKS